ncbi:hypothetical protein [Streptomyces eurythermus]|uniref:hypothetical protein n=1 Tax=Streptomyces eurythermus TaxID=42237 RepID=UPI00340B90A1
MRSPPCDLERFAAMGVAEPLLHTHDITQGLSVDWLRPQCQALRVGPAVARGAAEQPAAGGDGLEHFGR